METLCLEDAGMRTKQMKVQLAALEQRLPGGVGLAGQQRGALEWAGLVRQSC